MAAGTDLAGTAEQAPPKQRSPEQLPPEDAFWQVYSPNYELPIASLISVFVHVLLVAGAVAIFLLAYHRGNEKSSVPITLVEGGFDDAGEGSPGSGGVSDPLARGDLAPSREDYAALPLPVDLPTIRDEVAKQIALEDPAASIRLSDEKAAELALLDKAIRDKLLGAGERRGSGSGRGSGDGGQAGTGPGGYGADSTRARGLRWVIRFRTSSGQDYLAQLRSLGAILVIPTPPDFKTRMYIFRDLNNPVPGTVMTPEDWDALANQIRFCDFKQESGRQISEALGLPFTAPYFWAFFPKGLENELARMETAYQNRRAEDIEETVFQAVQRAGGFELVVARQTLKR